MADERRRAPGHATTPGAVVLRARAAGLPSPTMPLKEGSAPAPRAPGVRALLLLAGGLLAIHAAFWVGPFGVLDLYDYASNGEHLWLEGRWDMHSEAAGEPRFSRFSIGLPIISAPFVYAGQFLEWLSGGVIARRWAVATIPPLALVAGCLLLERIALLLGRTPSAARWAAIILGVSGGALYYTRCYYVEPVVGAWALFALYAFLRARASAGRRRWLALCGLGAGLGLMCHYANLALFAGLGLACALSCWLQAAPTRRLGDLAALAAVPVVVVLAVMGMNWHCYGGPLRVGYVTYVDTATVMIPLRLDRNLLGLGKLLLGAPWLALGTLALWHARRAPAPWRQCALGVLLAIALQQLFWLSFSEYYRSPLRYELPLLMLSAVALPALAESLQARAPQRGLPYATLVLVALGVASFLSGNNDFDPPFVNDPEDPMFPGQVTFAGWYARALPFHRRADYQFMADGFDPTYSYPLTPLGGVQLGVLALLVGGGALLLVRAWRLARAADADPAADDPAAADPAAATAERSPASG